MILFLIISVWDVMWINPEVIKWFYLTFY
jgi:hypothetical protein